MLGERFCLQQYYPKDEEIVYRYTPFYKFEDLLSTKELYFSRGDRFDKEEGQPELVWSAFIIFQIEL